MTTAMVTKTQLKGSVSAQRKALREKDKAAKSASKGKRKGTKVRHGINQQSAIELNDIVRAARGDHAEVLRNVVRVRLAAARTAKADAHEAMAANDFDRVSKAMLTLNVAKTQLRVALKDYRASNATLAASVTDVLLASKCIAIVRSFAATYSDDNEMALRIGTFDGVAMNEIRNAMVALLEVAAKHANKVGNRNGYKA
jgi:hypothetical protein